jgi:hypothetical protein
MKSNKQTNKCSFKLLGALFFLLDSYMNWGWNGNQNGWFSSGVFAPYGSGGSNYNNGLKMITGIR